MGSEDYRLGDIIRGWRERAGYTQEQFATLVGLSRSQTVSEWENSKYFPSKDNLLEIASVLGLNESEKDTLYKAAATADLSRVDANLKTLIQTYKSSIEKRSRQIRSATGIYKIDQGYVHLGLQDIASKEHKITREQDIGPQQIPRNSEPDISADSLLLTEEIHAMIIAPAGSGKTFLQKHLSLLLARDFAGDVLPVPIDWPFECCDMERQELLAGVLSGSDLSGEAFSRLAKYLDQRLCNGTAVALIDNWSENLPSVKILDTCLARWKRVIIFSRYAPSSDSPLLQVYELTHLGSDGMRRLVRDWPLITSRILDAETTIAHIQNSYQLRDLLSTPLFLDLYCAWWAEHSTAPTVWELLEWATDRISQGETGPGSLNVRFRSALELLAWDGYAQTLAGASFRNEFDAMCTEKLWRDHFGDDGPTLFDLAYERGLVRKIADKNMLVFPHPMLQAVFAAHKWVQLPKWLEIVKRVACCPPWVDVTVFAAATLEQQGNLVDLEHLLENLLSPDIGDTLELNWLLAGRCVAVLSEQTREMLEKHGIGVQIQRQFVGWLYKPPSWKLFHETCNLLSAMHTQALVDELSQFVLVETHKYKRAKVIKVLGKIGTECTINTLSQIAQNVSFDWHTRAAAVDALGLSKFEGAVGILEKMIDSDLYSPVVDSLANHNSLAATKVLLDKRFGTHKPQQTHDDKLVFLDDPQPAHLYNHTIGQAISLLSNPIILSELESHLSMGAEIDTYVLAAIGNVGGEKAVRILEQYLFHPANNVVEWAADLLAKMNNPIACDVLVRLAEDPKQPGWKHMLVLQKLPRGNALWDPKRLVTLLLSYGSDDGINAEEIDAGSTTLGVVNALRRSRDARIVQTLQSALAQAKGRARQLITQILAELKRNDAAPILKEVMNDPDPYVRENVFLGLAYLHEPDAADLVWAEFKQATDDGRVMDYLWVALAEVGDERAIPLLKKYVRTHQPGYTAAITALGKIGGEKASKIVAAYGLRHLIEYDSLAASELLPALVRCGTATTTWALLTIIENTRNIWLRQEAANQLGKVNSTDALDVLIDALAHVNPDIREGAARALTKMRSPKAVPGLLLLGTDPVDWVQDSAFKTIGAGFDAAQPGMNTALQALISAIRNEHDVVRRMAWIGLSQFPPQLIQDDLLHSIQEVIDQEQSISVLGFAIDALSKVGGSRAVPYLCSLLTKFKDRQALLYVIETLGEIGDASAVPDMVQTLCEHFHQCSDMPSSPWLSLARKGFLGELVNLKPKTTPLLDLLCLNLDIRLMPDNQIYLPDGRLLPCEKAMQWL